MPRLTINAPSVVSEIIDGEAVIMNLDSGHYFSTRGTGAAVWSLIELRWSSESIAQALVRRYALSPASAELALRDFLAELDRHSLLRSADLAAGESGVGDALSDLSHFPPEWSLPSIEVFTDMEDLLLLDPIHDVGDAGWPMPQPGPSRA